MAECLHSDMFVLMLSYVILFGGYATAGKCFAFYGLALNSHLLYVCS